MTKCTCRNCGFFGGQTYLLGYMVLAASQTSLPDYFFYFRQNICLVSVYLSWISEPLWGGRVVVL